MSRSWNKELGLASRLHDVLYVILLSISIYVSWELPFFSSKDNIIVLEFTIFFKIPILTRINLSVILRFLISLCLIRNLSNKDKPIFDRLSASADGLLRIFLFFLITHLTQGESSVHLRFAPSGGLAAAGY